MDMAIASVSLIHHLTDYLKIRSFVNRVTDYNVIEPNIHMRPTGVCYCKLKFLFVSYFMYELCITK